MARVCPTDSTFGPTVGDHCRGSFDFTLLFEDSIFALLPQCFFLLLAPIRYSTLRLRRERLTKHSRLGTLKVVATFIYAASSTALLVLWSEARFRTRETVAAAVFELLGSLTVIALSRLEHTRAVRPSHLLQLFLLVLLATDAVRLRTLFLMKYESSLVSVASVHTFLTAMLLLLESLDKSELLSDTFTRLSPEDTIGLFAQKLFWHLNGLFRAGYRQILEPDDLFSLDGDLTAESLQVSFRESWAKTRNKEKRLSLLWTIVKVIPADIVIPVIPMLLQIGMTISQTFLIPAITKYVQTPDSETTRNTGYGLLAAFSLDYMFLAIFSAWHLQALARFKAKIRGGLISLLYGKTLEISPKDVNMGSATILMNVDVEKVVEGLPRFHEFWSAAVQSGIASYILYHQLGIAFLGALVSIFSAAFICSILGSRIRPRQLNYVGMTEKRVKSVSDMVASVKGIRMLGLTSVFENRLTDLRETEVKKSNYSFHLLSIIIAIANFIFPLAALATYALFAGIDMSKGSILDFSRLFSSLSALKLITTPLLPALQSIATFQNAFSSLERIHRYLVSENHGKTSENHNIQGLDGRSSYCLQAMPHYSDTVAICLRNATIGIDTDKPIIRNANLEIPSHALTIIIGQVASGKSVFLRCLAREIELLDGTMSRSQDSVAFCSQTPWLRNQTLRENIIGESDFSSTWYNQVVYACGLQEDFVDMSQGDLTVVGSKGIALSGGQKNRMSLARAVYSRQAVLIIDDVLSGLDSTTERLVFHRVFGKQGLLRKSNSTVVLATHSLKWVQEADLLVILQSGNIVESDTPERLIESSELFKDLINDQSSETSSDNGVDENEDQTPVSLVKATPAKNSPLDDYVIDDDRRSGDKAAFKYYLSAIGLKHCIIFFSVMVLESGMTFSQFLWLKLWASFNDQSLEVMYRHLTIFIVISVLAIAFISIWIAHFSFGIIPSASRVLHARQLKALLYASFPFIVSTDIGNITNRFSQDIALVDRNLPYAFINTTGEILNCALYFGLVVVATPPIAALVPFLLGISWVIQRVYLRTSRQMRLMDLEAKAPLCTHFLETLAGISTVRAFGWSESYDRQNMELLNLSQRPFYLLAAIQNWLHLVLQLMVAGIVIVTVGLAIPLKNKLDAGFLGLALVGTMDLGIMIKVLVTSWTDLETSLSAITRIRKFATNTPQENSFGPQSIPVPTSPSKVPLETIEGHGNPIMSGCINFQDFAAGYSLTPHTPSVLQSINLTINSGERIAVVGRTGSGKSSLVASIFGLLNIRTGSISIDGLNLGAASGLSWTQVRESVVALPQEPVFIGESVLAHVDLLGTLRDIAGYSSAVSLLDLSMDTVEAVLSHGQRALLALARALVQARLRNAKIMVLDEATSSVDAETEKRMLTVCDEELFRHRPTVIAIAHRLETVMKFDRIVVMDAGKIVEVGSPGELMRKDGGRFRGLVETEN
ncbi:P-loop containing nucleoside triphosphate hydrolase protein [Eremomyces bilateralis CBS 781.70]|uniref:P-loop containing nucleoside triphosphate hydrolase protein n=1 Tax=Eremomyces bilateralis CBS 781.70 TaxID=1392243 RepID=A0A6G1FUR7_9PEZI|nr:P-loop containing nucleoside triphosphate hydrolase protein [Eremomyces bilateralis CBS 781.70]KAF1809448.1 P-loop containing nucleoside triphosphate hydrolase protein [Eremomyces bilateralis CBS 781.70]